MLLLNRTRIPSKLTATKVKSSKPQDKPYKLSDGGGLYLLVNPSGSKYWRMKYRYDGKEKTLSIGVYPDASLSYARKTTLAARVALVEGSDPGRLKKLEKLKRQSNSFAEIAKEWWNNKKGGWSEKHAKRVWKSIENEIIPIIGNVAIHDIVTTECLDVIRKVEKRGALDVASRVKQRLESIFNYAISIGKITHNPTSPLTGVIAVRKTVHMKALPTRELPKFLHELESSDALTDVVRYALKLIVITFVRPGEIRFAEWKDFDFTNNEWRIPANKTKMKREHVVPLSKQALSILEKVKKITGKHRYVFTGYHDYRKPISENALVNGIKKSLGFNATAHGFRTLASTTLNEEGFNRDVIERQLAHVEQNKVRDAYNRYEYIKERVEMMQWWGDYLDEL